MSNPRWMRRLMRALAWVCVGGMVIQASCSLTLQNAVYSAVAQFLSDYISAILQQYVPRT
jgi:hypothetical protein